MRRYTLTLVADEPNIYPLVGNFLRLLTAVGDITCHYEGVKGHGNKSILEEGLGHHIDGVYSKIRFTSTTNQTIVFYAGFGKIDDSRLTVSANLPVYAVPPSVINGFDDVTLVIDTPTIIVAANANAKRHHIKSNNANVAIVRIGAADCAADNGRELLPDGEMIIETTAAIYGFSPIVTSVISITSEES